MTIESDKDLQGLKRASEVAKRAMLAMRSRIAPGVTTAEIDSAAEEVTRASGARSAPRLVYDFPGCACISVNDEIVHGVPGDRRLERGDVVTIDMTAELDGYIVDVARTIVVPPVSRLKRRLVASTRSAFHRAMKVTRAGRQACEIGRVVEREAQRRGFEPLADLSGHGVGRTIHEEPSIPNVEDRRCDAVLHPGQVLAVEPILSVGARASVLDGDGWTVRTENGGLSAHFENTIVVTRGRPLVLTAA